MKKVIISFAFGFLVGIIAVKAQSGKEQLGKTYYDADQMKPHEVFSFKDVNTTATNVSKTSTKVKHGPYFYYYENGKLKISGSYKDDLKHGKWSYFNDKGILEKTEVWENDKLISTK
jgi:antitoxin component YwqK of YwqJK toxin-antitoxin module